MSMPIGVNCHPQAFGSVGRDIAMLKRFGPTFCRVSALQFGVISQGNATRVKQMVDAGLKVVGLCTSETCATMSDAAWSAYCQSYKKWAMWAGVMYDQVGNEWNGPFWNGAQDVKKACRRFNMGQSIIGRPCIAPGVTCENKSNSSKTSAISWTTAFLSETSPLAFDLHWYSTDVKQKSVFDECVKLLKGNIVTVLETGCSDASAQLAWYKGVKKGVWGALPERVLLYAYNDPWMPQFALVDKNTNPSPLAKMILAGTA